MRVLLILFYVLFAAPLFGQTAVDSLAVVREVDSLIQVSIAFARQGDFDKALETSAITEKLAVERLGQESAAHGKCCYVRGILNYNKADFPTAEEWFLKAIDIQTKVLGTEHPDFAATINDLAILYARMGNLTKAETLFLEVIAIREKAFGKEHPLSAKSRMNLALIYIYKGEYEKSILILLVTKDIFAKTAGKEHPDYLGTLSSLGSAYKGMFNFEKAEPFFREALELQAKTTGRKNLIYAGTLMNLGDMYRSMGDFDKAESLLLEAREIFDALLKTPDNGLLICLDNLATLYNAMGNNEKAKAFLLKEIKIRNEVMGKDHFQNAMALTQLAGVYEETGEWEKAEPLLLEALAIREKTWAKEDLDYVIGLYELGWFYSKMGDLEKAEKYYHEAQDNFEKANGQDNRFYASCLYGLGCIYMDKGEIERTEPLFIKSKAIIEKYYGKNHSNYLVVAKSLAECYTLTHNYEKSESLIQEIATLNRYQSTKALQHLSETEMQRFLASFSEYQNYTLYFSHRTKGKMAAALCFDNSLFYKGFLLNAAENMNRLARLDSASIDKLNTLKGYERILASEYTLPLTERDSSRVNQLEEKANALEKEITRTVSGYGTAIRQVNWQEVRSSLKPGEMAVEFIHYNTSPDTVWYAALLLCSDDEQPHFVTLFEQRQLEGLLSGKTRKADYVNKIYGLESGGIHQKNLYELIWQPLEKYMSRGVKTVYFSPSGLLHRLNLDAIPINGKEILSDRYRLTELGSTRQLVITPIEKKGIPNGGEALLFGGVQYDMNADLMTSITPDPDKDFSGTRGGLSFRFTDSTGRTGSWNYLKWTDKEVTALEPILKSALIQSTIRKGYDAAEEAFKSIGVNQPSPRILHVATHGFFFPDPALSKDRQSVSRMDAEPSFKISDHPMIRSGLILAGGNHAWKTGKPYKEGMEDGILTAYEISQMNLSNTELVVLSACETGLGDIQGNEGVYGLQRAFKIAGAKYLIMSLWQVPDFQTQELMTTFYTNWLTKKMPIPDAFRAAQQTMRKKYEHPYFWAGFVLVE